MEIISWDQLIIMLVLGIFLIRGGNLNSIGIETMVNKGSDLYFDLATLCKT